MCSPPPLDDLDARTETLFRDLGVIGLRAALPVLGGLVLGENVLLVGAPGTAKTTLGRAIARGLGLDPLHYLDCSKALLEDMLGFPDPTSLTDGSGELRYVETPLSLRRARSLLADEVSRCHPSTQSKWLEIFRERSVFGAPLPHLQLVIGAMNPPGAETQATYPLDEALAGRFTVVFTLPTVGDLEEADRHAVIRAVSAQDAPALPCERPAPPRPDALRVLIERARALYAEVTDDDDLALVHYVDAAAQAFARSDLPLDGRRLGSLRRLARACLAVARAWSRPDLPVADAALALRRALESGLPFAAMGVDASAALIRGAHELGLAALTGRPILGRWLLPSDPLRLADALIHTEVGPHERQAALTRLIETSRREVLDAHQRAFALLGLARLAHALTAGAVDLPPDEAQRVLQAWSEISRWDGLPLEHTLETLSTNVGADPRTLEDPRRNLCIRIALLAHHTTSHRFHPRGHVQHHLGALADELHERLEQLEERS